MNPVRSPAKPGRVLVFSALGAVRWLLRFVAVPLDGNDTDDVQEHLETVCQLGAGLPRGSAKHWTPANLRATQAALNEFFRSVAQRTVYEFPASGTWTFVPVEAERVRRSRPMKLQRLYYGDLTEQTVLAASALLTRVGADRLRACPPPCGQLLLATKRQEYCCSQHRKAAESRMRRRTVFRGARRDKGTPK